MPENQILNVRVAGVSFDGRQEYIARLIGNEPCRLEPEPDNKFDPNAIAVKVAPNILNPEPLDAYDPNHVQDQQHTPLIWHIGYLPKEIAAQIAPHLEGEPIMCKISEITGGFELRNGDIAPLGVRLEIELPGIDSRIPF